MQVLKTTSPLAEPAPPPRSPMTAKPSSSTSARRSANRGYLGPKLTADGCIENDRPATADSHHHPASQPHARKGGVAAAALEAVGIYLPFRRRVDQNPLVLGPPTTDHAGRLDQRPVEDRPGHVRAEQHPERGLESVESRSPRLLGGRVVRGVVGCHRIDHAIEQALQDSV